MHFNIHTWTLSLLFVYLYSLKLKFLIFVLCKYLFTSTMAVHCKNKCFQLSHFVSYFTTPFCWFAGPHQLYYFVSFIFINLPSPSIPVKASNFTDNIILTLVKSKLTLILNTCMHVHTNISYIDSWIDR